MPVLVRIIVLCLAGVLLMSCASRRAARVAESHESLKQRQGFACSVEAVGACEGCKVQCAMGQPARCVPGKSAGDRCTVQASCKCGPS